jgi:hypothetical protein
MLFDDIKTVFLMTYRVPPHPALSPNLGERGRVRGLNGIRFNVVASVLWIQT